MSLLNDGNFYMFKPALIFTSYDILVSLEYIKPLDHLKKWFYSMKKENFPH